MSDEFELIRTLGEGAFGKVYLVKGNSDRNQYAMKIIDLRTSPAEEKELAVKEAELLKKLNHVNVLHYVESFESDGALCIVTEFCSRGDLSEYLNNRGKKKLEEDQLKAWFKQIASALQYLHNLKIIHRDVKTPNVFLSEKWEVKLGDMGLAKVLERPTSKAVTFCGSPYYMSPEIFSCKPYDSKSDIWALGVIVYEMATLERPFDAMLMHQLVFKIVHGGLPSMPTGYQSGLTALLTIIMQKDPSARPTADDVINHPYLQGMKPPVPPKDNPAGAVAGKSGYNIVKPIPGQKSAHGAGGPFDMQKLLDSLTVRQRKDKKKVVEEGAVGGMASVKGINTIIAPKGTPGKKKITEKFRKDVTIKPSPTKQESDVSVVSVSDVHIDEASDFEDTLRAVQSRVATDAFNVMQLIVKTMTGLFPRDDKEREEALKSPSDAAGSRDPQAVMLRQIEHLQFYCIKVLNNDVELFTQAYELLGREKDENKLEEQLIGVLGPEKFGLCGVQLMFLKNFEYNLSKLNK